jgi:hypothetical protein
VLHRFATTVRQSIVANGFGEWRARYVAARRANSEIGVVGVVASTSPAATPAAKRVKLTRADKS